MCSEQGFKHVSYGGMVFLVSASHNVKGIIFINHFLLKLYIPVDACRWQWHSRDSVIGKHIDIIG